MIVSVWLKLSIDCVLAMVLIIYAEHYICTNWTQTVIVGAVLKYPSTSHFCTVIDSESLFVLTLLSTCEKDSRQYSLSILWPSSLFFIQTNSFHSSCQMCCNPCDPSPPSFPSPCTGLSLYVWNALLFFSLVCLPVSTRCLHAVSFCRTSVI